MPSPSKAYHFSFSNSAPKLDSYPNKEGIVHCLKQSSTTDLSYKVANYQLGYCSSVLLLGFKYFQHKQHIYHLTELITKSKSWPRVDLDSL